MQTVSLAEEKLRSEWMFCLFQDNPLRGQKTAPVGTSYNKCRPLKIPLKCLAESFLKVQLSKHFISVNCKHKFYFWSVYLLLQSLRQPGLYLMDALFSIFVIGTLVVVAWRGLWGVMDLTLYPHDRAKSARGSLVKMQLHHFSRDNFTFRNDLQITCRWWAA